MGESVFPNKAFIAASQKFVALHAHSGTDPDIEREASSRWKPGNGRPEWKIIAPDGKEQVDGAVGFIDAAPLVKKIDAAIKKAGPGIPAADYQKMKTQKEEAAKAIEDKKYKDAIKVLKVLAGMKSKSSIVEDAKVKLDEIEKTAQEALAEAKKAEGEKNWTAAAAGYQKVTKDFEGSKTADEAKKALAELKKNPDAAEALKGAK